MLSKEAYILTELLGRESPQVKALVAASAHPGMEPAAHEMLRGLARQRGWDPDDLPRFALPEGISESDYVIGETMSGSVVGEEIGPSEADLPSHIGVFGMTNTGKSTLVKLLLCAFMEKTSQNIPNHTFCILDMHDDYRDLLPLFGPEQVVWLTADEVGVNPFEVPLGGDAGALRNSNQRAVPADRSRPLLMGRYSLAEQADNDTQSDEAYEAIVAEGNSYLTLIRPPNILAVWTERVLPACPICSCEETKEDLCGAYFCLSAYLLFPPSFFLSTREPPLAATNPRHSIQTLIWSAGGDLMRPRARPLWIQAGISAMAHSKETSRSIRAQPPARWARPPGLTARTP